VHQAVAQLLGGSRATLTASARDAGWTGPVPQLAVLVGHSSGGNLAVDVAGHLADTPAFTDLRAVVMLDGASQDAGMAQMRAALPKISGLPVLQVGSPPSPCLSDRRGTAALVESRPGVFVGVELVGGNHLDAIGYEPFNLLAYLVCGWPNPSNVAAAHTIATDWILNALTGTSQGITGGKPGQTIPVGAAVAKVLG
jgi:hypothetical protein